MERRKIGKEMTSCDNTSCDNKQATPKGTTYGWAKMRSTSFFFHLILLGLCFICYSNSLSNGFCFDDRRAITFNRDLLPTIPLYQIFFNDFWGTPLRKAESHKSYRPLCVLTFRLNYAIHGLKPMGYHLFNVICHWVTCVLILDIFQHFFSELLTLILGVLFVVHPVHTEAVTGTVGRAELLSAVFILLTVKTYIRGTTNNNMTNWKFMNLAALFIAIATLCKEQGITVVGICWTYELLWLKKLTLRKGLKLVKTICTKPRKLPSWFVTSLFRILYLLAGALLLMFVRVLVMGKSLPKFPTEQIPASAAPTPVRQLTQWYYLPVNVWLLVYPFPLLCDYTKGTIPLVLSITDPRNLATLLLIIPLLKLCQYAVTGNSKSSRQVAMALSFVVFPFLPASNLFVTVGFVIAERVLYVPSLGFSMLVVIGLKNLIFHKRFRTIVWCALVLTVTLHSAKTIRRNIDWYSQRSLFKSGLQITVNNTKLWNNVAHTYQDAGDHQMALAYYMKAAECHPSDILTRINVGKTYRLMNNYSKAMEYLSMAESLVLNLVKVQKRFSKPQLAVFMEMANIKIQETKYAEAIEHYQKVIGIYNESEDAYEQLGKLYLTLKELDKAEECYNKVLQIEPRSRNGLFHSAFVAYKKNRTLESLKVIERCLEIYPNDGEALRLKVFLEKKRRGTSELDRLLQLLKETENDYQTMTQVGIIYKKRGDLENAENYFNDARKINATYDVALFNLAFMYEKMKEYDKSLVAVSSFLEVITDDFRAWQLLCRLQADQFNNIDAASMALQEAYRLFPENVMIRSTFCVLMFKRKEYENAQKCFENLHQETKEEFIADYLRVVNKQLATMKGKGTM